MFTSVTEPTSLSIQSAAAVLLSWAKRQHDRAHQSSESFSPCAMRLQLPVLISHEAILPWLRSHPSPHKLFFRARNSAFQVAAVAFSHRASGPEFTSAVHAQLLSILDANDPNMRFYGGARFHNIPVVNPASDWAPFDGYTFVLPAIELFCDNQSCVFLAANYYPPSGVHALSAALAHVVAPPASLVTAHPTLMLPRACSVQDLTDYNAWDQEMGTILDHLSSHQYEKIVLARRKRFTFHDNATPNPLHVLSALAHQNSVKPLATSSANATSQARSSPSDAQSHTNAYLFCLQVDHDKAFLGCPPERLFKLDDDTVLTEALAGTVRRAPHDDEAEALATLLNEKNVREHRFVVDYVTAAMSRCKLKPNIDGPHVRRLPRLMHLATHLSATLPRNRATAPHNDVFQLLSELHPTPAVCGVPLEMTLKHIANIERFDRGLFAGPFGWFSAHAADFCVAIRSATVHGLCVTAYAGSGIVRASESASEWDETELKMSAFTDLFLAHSVIRNQSPLRANVGYNSYFSNSINGFHPENGNVVDNVKDSDSTHDDSICAQENGRTKTRLTRERSEVMDYFDPCDLESTANLNALWGCCLVEELCRNGIYVFFVSPGSRSAPLAVAVARSRHAKMHVAHDERGAGYMAVGYARATKRAAAVITSSGTAVANLLPAVVEAFVDELPLILLTADRPPELRDVGANQAIHQPDIFGRYVVWSKDIACACEEIPLRNLLSDVDYGVWRCGSDGYSKPQSNSRRQRGPVHLNIMFRENLAPDNQSWDRRYLEGLGSRWRTSVTPLTTYGSVTMNTKPLGESMLQHDEGFQPCDAEIGRLWNLLKKRRNGVIVLGGGVGSISSGDEGLCVYEMAELLGWPIVSDICGGLRLDSTCTGVIHYADLLLGSSAVRVGYTPDIVLQFGERVTSKRITTWIRNGSVTRDNFEHILVSNGLNRYDSHFTVTYRVNGNISTMLHAMQDAWNTHTRINGIESWKFKTNQILKLVSLSNMVNEFIETQMKDDERSLNGRLNEPWCARVLSKCLGIDRVQALFTGNSMPIRDMDLFGQSSDHGTSVRVVANRGASGIDGLISSGIGFAIGCNRDTTIFVGDMSLIHDLNALHVLRDKHHAVNNRVTVVVVNNGGGGIFSMLPISKHEGVFSPVFDTPHQIQFEGVSKTFGIDYVAVKTMSQLRTVLCDNQTGHRLIEVLVTSDHGDNAKLHTSLIDDIIDFVEQSLEYDKR